MTTEVKITKLPGGINEEYPPQTITPEDLSHHRLREFVLRLQEFFGADGVDVTRDGRTLQVLIRGRGHPAAAVAELRIDELTDGDWLFKSCDFSLPLIGVIREYFPGARARNPD